MKNKLCLAIIVIAITLTSCVKEPMYIQRTDNNQFQVEYLFTIDSCNVYRFGDEGRLHYIVIGSNVHQTQTYQGDKSQEEETIQTIIK